MGIVIENTGQAELNRQGTRMASQLFSRRIKRENTDNPEF